MLTLLEQAKKELNTLSQSDIAVLKSYTKPPSDVLKTMLVKLLFFALQFFDLC